MNADDPAAAGELSFEDIAATATETTTVLAASAPSESAKSAAAGLSDRFQSIDEFETWLVDAAVSQWGNLFGQTTYYPHAYYPHLDLVGAPIFLTGAVAFDAAMMRSGDAALATTAFTNDHSSTNVQVEGVDEADLVETDGEYLYIISGQDLVIVKAGTGDELQVESRVRLDKRPIGMYLSGDRLALVSSTGQSNYNNGDTFFIRPAVMTFDQPSDIEPEPPTTTVTVLDIANRTAPTMVSKTELDGAMITSRTVDGQLRLVVSNQIQLPMPIAKPIATASEPKEIVEDRRIINAETSTFMAIDSLWWPDGESEPKYQYETQAEYLARVRDIILDSVRPRMRSLAINGDVIAETTLFEPTDLNRPDSLDYRHVTTIATIDLSSNAAGPVDKTSVLTHSAAQVYSSVDSVYVFAQQQTNWMVWNSDSVLKTDVWKFSIDGETHEIELSAKGEFAGTLLNQFAADEHEGHLRVVTKSGGWGGDGQSVHVLAQADDELNVVGTIGGIAPNEELYSVRFMGDRAFFVTFRKVDPLFTVDLSDPANPQLLGELKIPGYSDYLQPIDENTVLAIGRGADEGSGLFEELQVSLFDVSDMADPQLLHRYSFDGGRSTATPVTGDRWTRGDGDHHGVSYFATEQVFAMPIFTADGGWSPNGVEETPIFEPGHGGLQVFSIDTEAGFTPLGIIEHDTLVERSVRIGERLYAVSSGTVSVHELDDPNVRLGKVDIAADADEPPTELTMYQAAIATRSPGSSIAVGQDVESRRAAKHAFLAARARR